MKNYILLLILLVYAFSNLINAQTTVKKSGDTWELIVDDMPFDVKGVTFGYDKDVKNYDTYFKDLQFLGVNTIRLWGTNENTLKLLDAAEKYKIKVMVGIWMRHGRPGMEDDDSFNYLEDKKGMETMYENAIQTVKKYKNHAAVLTWTIGNEVYLNMATDPEKVAYSKLLERICSDIKKIDSTHPIASVEAWTFGLEWWQKYVPSIDIYGLNSYGYGANLLSEELLKRNIDKPYIITEFGVTGEWDIQETKNGIKIEPTDTQKYETIFEGYHDWIKSKPNCLGVYVFHYANGNSFASPWLFTHHNGSLRPQYWAIREAFTGEKPINSVPVIETFSLPDSKFMSTTWIPVTLDVLDDEKDNLEVSFYYNQRTGSRKRRDQINKLEFKGNLNSGFKIQLPKEHGAIKVYVNVKDAYNNIGIASTSIEVHDDEAKDKKYLVPKASLPFYIYKDGEVNPYLPTAYMGNYKDIEVDLQHNDDVQSGNSCLRIGYNEVYGWYGLGFVDPANDWGEILGGYDITGAETFSFWAKASKKNIIATIGFGLIGKDKPYPDTAKISKEIKLSTKWKKYTIKLKNLDLTCIRSGFVLFTSSYGTTQDIFFDDVVFE
ncbi:MAG: hypothetical protein HKO92_08845 [Flavobacteriaceae bacterium]|nr:hypothetical protein [Bacteroidia bacterium]NNK83219.1 hypothetical protein [Flavobacteriaceae bacterium]